MRKALGDFQTPDELANAVVSQLLRNGAHWGRILEPTCGAGAFIRAMASQVKEDCEIKGIELQAAYVMEARASATKGHATVDICQGNIFDLALGKDLHWNSTKPILIIGNPPWVTNSVLGSLGSDNLPRKENLKGLTGLDAITGGANFDIAEYIWLKVIRELMPERPTIAMLCKTSVARNVLAYAYACEWPVVAATIHRIDSKKWFGAAVDSGLFTLTIGDSIPSYECKVYSSLDSSKTEATIGFVDGRMVADVDRYQLATLVDGECPLVWRQGLKHDAATIMELRTENGRFINKLGEFADVEPEFIYPLLKSSDLYKTATPSPRWSVIVPQKRVGQSTSEIEQRAPKLWKYLTEHEEYFDKRKSSIYKNQPRFAIFGVGEYSFAQHKVAVAGLSSNPRFWALSPIGEKAVMLDDTCYFVPCENEQQAQELAILLNSPECGNFLQALIFHDSKRPVTKKLLQRIDLLKLLQGLTRGNNLSSSQYELKSWIERHLETPIATQLTLGA